MKGTKNAPTEAGYESLYDEEITDFSYEELKRLSFWSRIKGPEFFLIGGWAAWHYHRGAGSRDIDIIFSDKTIMECFLPIYYRENGYTEVHGPMRIERRFEKKFRIPRWKSSSPLMQHACPKVDHSRRTERRTSPILN